MCRLLLFPLREERPPALAVQKPGHDNLAHRRRKIPLHLAHLRQISDAPAALLAVDLDLSFDGLDETEHGLHQGGFAGAVFAHDAHIIPRENLKRDVRNDRLVVVPEHRMVACDNRCVLITATGILHGTSNRLSGVGWARGCAALPCAGTVVKSCFNHTHLRPESQYARRARRAY